ncbi:MAG: thiamine pyrophosphate-binding protein, partial [Betaproteobacteria bacterium]|nr:thiamine pyrophosphate-binding protein [Betaproteobacteria bacterium]
MRGSELLVQSLVQAGVKYAFGMSGHSTSALLDSISREPSIRFILAKHENTIVSMADGIVRVTDTPAVCISHSGPSSPLVMITCNEEQSRLTRDVMNGWDQLTPFRSITKWSERPTSARDIPRIMRSAFVRSRLGRPGPVQVDLPLDISEQEAGDIPAVKAPPYESYSSRVRPDPDLIVKLAEQLLKAKQPMILAGAGVIRSKATPELVQFAELTGVPVANTTGGRGALPENHPQFVGVPGRWGHRTTSEALKDS